MPLPAYIALGSNLGDRHVAIRTALAALDVTPGITVRALSTIRETEPWGVPAQGRFLNATVGVVTTLSARDLLNRCLAIEAAQGGTEERSALGTAPIDLDLLLFDDQVIDEPGLRVPHPRLHERSFVLEPLAEIAPSLVHPVLGRSIECLRNVLAGVETSGTGGS